jgi:alkaline phosphatase
MKKLVYTLFFVLISVVANGQAKYVFYFIGDGMGVNQVNGTEMYQAEIQNGRIGVEPFDFLNSLIRCESPSAECF